MSYLFLQEEHSYAKHQDEDSDHWEEQPLLAVKYAIKYNPTKQGFMEYLKEAIQIETKISYK